MDITLVAVNSKYIHTNPAVRSIKYYIEKRGFSAEIFEFSGKEEIHRAAIKIVRSNAPIAAFSCYIWNIDYIIKLAQFQCIIQRFRCKIKLSEKPKSRVYFHHKPCFLVKNI